MTAEDALEQISEVAALCGATEQQEDRAIRYAETLMKHEDPTRREPPRIAISKASHWLQQQTRTYQ